MNLIYPLPFAVISKPTFVSPPAADKDGLLLVALFVTSKWFTAADVVWNINCSLLFSSNIPWASSIPIFCEFVSKFPPNCGVEI